MRPPANKRKRVPGAYCTLWLLAVVCLSLSLQPCVMAAVDDREHAHCLPLNDQGDKFQQSAAQDLSWPAPPQSVSCSDCMLFGDYSRDARDGQVKVKNPQHFAPFAITDTSTALPYIQRTAMRIGARHRYATPGVPPPLNLLHCVHLK